MIQNTGKGRGFRCSNEKLKLRVVRSIAQYLHLRIILTSAGKEQRLGVPKTTPRLDDLLEGLTGLST